MTSLDSLANCARAIVSAPSTSEKVSIAQETAERWQKRSLSKGRLTGGSTMPSRPGRPDRPALLPPRDMPKRSAKGARGRLALIHSLAHIELNAIDLTWDLIGRFIDAPLPPSYFDDWVQVGLEESQHFQLLSDRLSGLGHAYGDLPAHDGLWQAAQDTGHCLRARLAVVPLVLEARGLDVAPPMIVKTEAAGDFETASILRTIYNDEKKHVGFGAKWFRHVCETAGLRPDKEFQRLVRKHFRGALKPPFNDKARSEAGLSPGFYKPLVGLRRFD